MPKSITVDSNNVYGKFVEEAGTYNVKFTKVEYKKSANGNEMIEMDAQVLDGIYKGAEIRLNHIVWVDDSPSSINATEKSAKRFNTLAVALGAQDGATVTLPQIAQTMLLKPVNANFEWPDEPDSKGNYYLSANANSFAPLDSDGSKPNGVKNPKFGKKDVPTQGSPNPFANTSIPNNVPSGDPFASKGNAIDIKDDDLPF